MTLRLPLLLCLACLTLTGQALAQSTPPGMKMHRIQAGEPDAEGWMLAASTEGGFSVRMPLKFNDFTVAESKPGDPVLRAFTVGARSQEGIKFMATRIVYRDGASSAKSYFARFEKGADLKPENISPLTIRDRKAVDLVIRNATSVSYQRVMLLQNDLLMLVVESPLDFEDTAHELTSTFFDSALIRTP